MIHCDCGVRDEGNDDGGVCCTDVRGGGGGDTRLLELRGPGTVATENKTEHKATSGSARIEERQGRRTANRTGIEVRAGERTGDTISHFYVVDI